MKHKAFTLTEVLIIGALFGLFVLGGTALLASERARTRDAKRIADMTRLSAGFALLYGQKASYTDAAAGCPKVGSLASSCTLVSFISGLDTVKDPSAFTYSVTRVPDKDDYGISFHLERSYGALQSGVHTLSKAGIR